MPHEDALNGKGLGEVSFTEPNEDNEEEEANTSSELSNGLRSLYIEEPATQRHIGIKVSSASARSSSSKPNHLQMCLVPEREDESTYATNSSSECAPAPRGWSRIFPSRP